MVMSFITDGIIGGDESNAVGEMIDVGDNVFVGVIVLGGVVGLTRINGYCLVGVVASFSVISFTVPGGLYGC